MKKLYTHYTDTRYEIDDFIKANKIKQKDIKRIYFCETFYCWAVEYKERTHKIKNILKEIGA